MTAVVFLRKSWNLAKTFDKFLPAAQNGHTTSIDQRNGTENQSGAISIWLPPHIAPSLSWIHYDLSPLRSQQDTGFPKSPEKSENGLVNPQASPHGLPLAFIQNAAKHKVTVRRAVPGAVRASRNISAPLASPKHRGDISLSLLDEDDDVQARLSYRPLKPLRVGENRLLTEEDTEDEDDEYHPSMIPSWSSKFFKVFGNKIRVRNTGVLDYK